MHKQAGEVLRRTAWTALDRVQGGRLEKMLAVNKAEIVRGVTEEYRRRRLQAVRRVHGELPSAHHGRD